MGRGGGGGVGGRKYENVFRFWNKVEKEKGKMIKTPHGWMLSDPRLGLCFISIHLHNVPRGLIKDEQRCRKHSARSFCDSIFSFSPPSSPFLFYSIVALHLLSLALPHTSLPWLWVSKTNKRDKGNTWQFATLSTSHPSYINASLASFPPPSWCPNPHLLLHILPLLFSLWCISPSGAACPFKQMKRGPKEKQSLEKKKDASHKSKQDACRFKLLNNGLMLGMDTSNHGRAPLSAPSDPLRAWRSVQGSHYPTDVNTGSGVRCNFC